MAGEGRSQKVLSQRIDAKTLHCIKAAASLSDLSRRAHLELTGATGAGAGVTDAGMISVYNVWINIGCKSNVAAPALASLLASTKYRCAAVRLVEPIVSEEGHM